MIILPIIPSPLFCKRIIFISLKLFSLFLSFCLFFCCDPCLCTFNFSLRQNEKRLFVERSQNVRAFETQYLSIFNPPCSSNNQQHCNPHAVSNIDQLGKVNVQHSELWTLHKKELDMSDAFSIQEDRNGFFTLWKGISFFIMKDSHALTPKFESILIIWWLY